MTHDELLQRIAIIGNTSIEEALRAVVDLHKPNKSFPEFCDVCWWEEHERENYPCQTIQAVEEELSRG